MHKANKWKLAKEVRRAAAVLLSVIVVVTMLAPTIWAETGDPTDLPPAIGQEATEPVVEEESSEEHPSEEESSEEGLSEEEYSSEEFSSESPSETDPSEDESAPNATDPADSGATDPAATGPTEFSDPAPEMTVIFNGAIDGVLGSLEIDLAKLDQQLIVDGFDMAGDFDAFLAERKQRVAALFHDVTATDENGEPVPVALQDDGGFADAEIPPETLTLTYAAVHPVSEETFTATREVTITFAEIATLEEPAEDPILQWLVFSADGTTLTGFVYQAGVSPTAVAIPRSHLLNGVEVDITAIGADAFANSGVTVVEFDPDSQITSIGANAFRNLSITSIDIPDGVTSIGDAAFSYCGLLESVVFPDTLQTIGSNAFQNCTKLLSIDSLPSTVSLGTYVFAGCSALTSVDWSGFSMTALPDWTFSGCGKLQSLQLPANLISIGDYAINSCYALTEVWIPATVTTIAAHGLQNLPEGSVVDLQRHPFNSIAGAPWSAPRATLKWMLQESDDIFLFDVATGFIGGIREDKLDQVIADDGHITIPAKITMIENGIPVEYDVKGLTEGAFASSPSNAVIKSVDFAENSAITTIADGAFQSCASLKSVALPDSLTSIGNNAFAYCEMLTDVLIPDSVTSIGEASFRGCISMEAVDLPESLLTIGSFCFANCDSLTSVSIPASTTLIGINAFMSCPLLKTVTFAGSAIQKINGAFGGCPLLAAIYLEQVPFESIAGFPWGASNAAIYWMDDEITLPVNIIDSTGNWVFQPATGTIVEYRGEANENLELTVPSVLFIDGFDTPYPITWVGFERHSIFTGSLKSITFDDGIERILEGAFSGVRFDSLDLGSSVDYVGPNAFSNCGISSLTLSDALTTVSNSAFANNNLDGEIVIPGNVTSLDITAFDNNPGIDSFLLHMYRNGISGTEYNLVPEAVKNNAPWNQQGTAEHSVFYMDDPRPTYTSVITTDANTNTAIITLSVIMNAPGSSITAITAGEDMPPIAAEDPIPWSGDTLSSVNATMTVNSSSTGDGQGGNDRYTFIVEFGDGATYECYVDVSHFNSVTYSAGDGTLSGALPADPYPGGHVPLHTVTIQPLTGTLAKQGYDFGGWHVNGDSTRVYKAGETFPMPSGNVELTPAWTASESTPYTVKHYKVEATGAETLADTETQTGTTGTVATATQKSYEGYTYDSAESTVTGIIAADGSLVLELYYNANVHNVTYNYTNTPDGAPSLPATTSAAYGTTAIALAPAPVLEGYAFSGWTTDDATVTDGVFTMPDKNVDFTGTWVAVYTVRYLPGTHGAFPARETSGLKAGDPTPAAPTPTGEPGWNFKAWDPAPASAVTGNAEYTAQWEPIIYTVTYQGDGTETGSPPAQQTANYNDVITLEGPGSLEKALYTLVGWCDNDNNFYAAGEPYTVKGSVTFTAVWVAAPYVLYHQNGGTGSIPPAKHYEAGTSVTVEGAPGLSREGYSYSGWAETASGPVKYEAGDVFLMPPANVELYAAWEADVYDVTFHYNWGSRGVIKTVAVPFGETVGAEAPSPGIRSRYEFIGWNTLPGGNGDRFTAATAVTANTNVYAQWDYIPPDSPPEEEGDETDPPTSPTSPRATEPPTTPAGTEPPTIPPDDEYSIPAGIIPTDDGGDDDGGEPESALAAPPNAEIPDSIDRVEVTQRAPPSLLSEPAASSPIAATVDDGGEPLLNLFNNEVPLFAPWDSGAWALLNLILCTVGALFAASVIIRALLLRRALDKGAHDSMFSGKKTTLSGEAVHSEDLPYRVPWLVASIALGVAGGIVFLLTQDMSLRMVLVDGWTIMNSILLTVELVAVVVTFKRKKQGMPALEQLL